MMTVTLSTDELANEMRFALYDADQVAERRDQTRAYVEELEREQEESARQKASQNSAPSL